MHKGSVCYIEDGRVRVLGSTFGYGDSDPHLVRRGDRHLVVKLDGRHDWSSVGKSSYYAARWYLVQVRWTSDATHKDRFVVTEVVDEREPGKDWRLTRRELIAKLTALEALARP